MALPVLVTDHWYDFRDLGNLSGTLLDALAEVCRAAPSISSRRSSASCQLYVLCSSIATLRRRVRRAQAHRPRSVALRSEPRRAVRPAFSDRDTIKLMQKQALHTDKRRPDPHCTLRRRFLWRRVCCSFAVLPFGPNMVFADIPFRSCSTLPFSAMPVLSAFIAGWSHNNKYSVFGSIRIVAMAISYEVPLVLGLLGVVLLTGHTEPASITVWQKT